MRLLKYVLLKPYVYVYYLSVVKDYLVLAIILPIVLITILIVVVIVGVGVALSIRGRGVVLSRKLTDRRAEQQHK